MPDGVVDRDEEARTANSESDLAIREEVEKPKKVVGRLTAASSAAARNETQNAGTESATGEQRKAAVTVQLQGLGVRAGTYSSFSQTRTPKFDGSKYSWPTEYDFFLVLPHHKGML